MHRALGGAGRSYQAGVRVRDDKQSDRVRDANDAIRELTIVADQGWMYAEQSGFDALQLMAERLAAAHVRLANEGLTTDLADTVAAILLRCGQCARSRVPARARRQTCSAERRSYTHGRLSSVSGITVRRERSVSEWPAAKARRVLAALRRVGWTIKREAGSHKVRSLSRRWYERLGARLGEEFER